MKSGQLITAMVTPMHKDGKVNYVQAVELAKRLGENGSDGVVLSGTTGESPTLTFEEKAKLYGEVTDALGGQIEIIAGTGSYNTAETIALTKAAENAGVDGIMPRYPLITTGLPKRASMSISKLLRAETPAAPS